MLKLFCTRRVPMTDCGQFAPASNWRNPLLVNQSTRAWKTPRTQATPACTFASTAHAGCRVLRTVPHYCQSKPGHSACGRRRARAITHIQSTENTTLLQTSSDIQRLHHDFTAQTLQYTVNLTIDKIQSMKLIKVQPIPVGVSLLEHLFCHVSVKKQV